MAEYDRELMRQMVQLMNEQDDSVESEEGGEHGAN